MVKPPLELPILLIIAYGAWPSKGGPTRTRIEAVANDAEAVAAILREWIPNIDSSIDRFCRQKPPLEKSKQRG